MDLGLNGKAAFVTGGSHGIGLAIARALIAEGASVVVCGRDEERLAGCGVPGVRADVMDPGQLGRAVDEAAERLGGLDLLVANAGGSFGGGLLDSTPEEWADTFAINALHAAHAIRTAVPHFERRGGGSALIVSSITGWKPGPRSSYAAAKAAEIHLAAALAQELGPRGIRVNALSPGSVEFEGGGWAWVRENRPDEFARFAREDFPRGSLVTLSEVADTAVFVLSARGGGISGANICVDAAQDHPSSGRFFPV
ncbi:3-oxoacyl-[acyl-carrier protein] reductase [Actinacidiphila alni]|uniref:3-oxoacyl-[acyl-carrier protein] reductase n=1 Tax=Actinacidiphila alni TaxID=380248 RepID=A0A1I2H219_9ACTN|nr:SDR family oxidoreductase [Actinacidiphila alni]SFF24155.1 3-oxoacyl-[acyl-carrier protein] reductase [Actinacidiphila alni]